MEHINTDQHFLLDQIQEIQLYIQQHSDEEPDNVVLFWIERYADDFRKKWTEYPS